MNLGGEHDSVHNTSLETMYCEGRLKMKAISDHWVFVLMIKYFPQQHMGRHWQFLSRFGLGWEKPVDRRQGDWFEALRLVQSKIRVSEFSKNGKEKNKGFSGFFKFWVKQVTKKWSQQCTDQFDKFLEPQNLTEKYFNTIYTNLPCNEGILLHYL